MQLTNRKPEEQLIEVLPKHSGRDNRGHVSSRHRGGRHKRYYRVIDWKRDRESPAKVVAVEYDPNRTAHIALVQYADGQKRYIVAPVGLQVGDTVAQSENAAVAVGNTLALTNIPIGTQIHNIELVPGRGAQMVRSAGNFATLLAKEDRYAQVKLPSGEIRLIALACKATIGQVGNIEHAKRHIGKAGRSRHMGRRPIVRGVAQNPRSHPHGGGEGRSGIGMPSPKSRWGKPTLGKKTRNRKKASKKFIVQRRK